MLIWFAFINKKISYLLVSKNMDVNKNLNLINALIASMRLGKVERFQIINLAKVSEDIDDLKSNMEWEENYKH